MRHACSHDGCSHLAVERCFDCGAYLCIAHSTAIRVPTYSGALREVVCSTCLQGYLAAPGPFGAALLESDPDRAAVPALADRPADTLRPGISGAPGVPDVAPAGA